MSEIVLHHFLFSHYNEKARWALAYKQVPHRRVGVIPGPHTRSMLRLSGQTKTPILQVDGEAVPGSAALIDRLESLFPEPPLYPAEPTEREQALAWQERLDEQLGPDTRSIVWGVLIEDPAYAARLFGHELNPLFKFLYGKLLARARSGIVKVNGVTPKNIARARQNVAALLDEIATAVEAGGYLVGGRFSVADLTAASLMSPVLRLTHADMRRPEPIPPALEALLDEYAAHPAMVWAVDMFRQHRPDTQ